MELFFLLLGLLVATGIWLMISGLQETRKSKDPRKNADEQKPWQVADLGDSTSKALRSVQVKAIGYSPVARQKARIALGWLNHHFSFQGTATRRQFILTQLTAGIGLGFVLPIGSSIFDSQSEFIQLLGIMVLMSGICAACWLVWAVSTKRTRDTGVTVWWVLTLLVPPLNVAAFIFMLLVPTNEFSGKGL
jgi:uncharacterized membrane protein YhaH (DUF805 family)